MLSRIIFNGPRKSLSGRIFAATPRAYSAKLTPSPLIQLIPVPRDYEQSVFKGHIHKTLESDSMRYNALADTLNSQGPAIIRAIEITGGFAGWEKLVLEGFNPMDLIRNYLISTPNGTPIAGLGRGQAGFARKDVSNDVLEALYGHISRAIIKTDKEHNPHLRDREFYLRFFHFNNTEFQKIGTEQVQSKLFARGITNFNIVDSTVYTDDMDLDRVAAGVINGIEKTLLRNGLFRPIEVEIKDFAGSMTAEKARVILEKIAEKRKALAEKHLSNPDFVAAIMSARVGYHLHRTHFSEGAPQAIIEGSYKFNIPASMHGISGVPNASHSILEDMIPHMRAAGVLVTDEQVKTMEEMRQVLGIILEKNIKIAMPFDQSGKATKGDHLAGGGAPSRLVMAQKLTGVLKVSEAEALSKLESQLHEFRTKNTIPLVTPALNNMTVLTEPVLRNIAEGKPKYNGVLPEEAIDTIRNLDPLIVKDKELLEVCYKQARKAKIEELLKSEAITKETADAIVAIGMNKNKTSLDIEATQSVLNTAGVSNETKGIIMEASGHLTKPHKIASGLKAADEQIEVLKKSKGLDTVYGRTTIDTVIATEDARVLIATLPQSGVGVGFVAKKIAEYPAICLERFKDSAAKGLFAGGVGFDYEDALPSPSHVAKIAAEGGSKIER
jgi:hypothetical protein